MIAILQDHLEVPSSTACCAVSMRSTCVSAFVSKVVLLLVLLVFFRISNFERGSFSGFHVYTRRGERREEDFRVEEMEMKDEERKKKETLSNNIK